MNNLDNLFRWNVLTHIKIPEFYTQAVHSICYSLDPEWPLKAIHQGFILACVTGKQLTPFEVKLTGKNLGHWLHGLEGAAGMLVFPSHSFWVLWGVQLAPPGASCHELLPQQGLNNAPAQLQTVIQNNPFLLRHWLSKLVFTVRES